MCDHDADVDESQQDPTYLDSILASATVQLLRVDECEAPEPRARPVVLVHAGVEPVGACPRDADAAAIRRAAIDGYKMIVRGASALDVMESVMRQLESYWVDECREKGAEFEADAVLVVGDCSRSAAIAAARNHRHPISLARLALEKTRQTLVVGTEVDWLAREHGENCGCVQFKVEDDADDGEAESVQGTNCASSERACSEIAAMGEAKPKDDGKGDDFKLKPFGCLIYSNESSLLCGKSVFRTSSFGRASSQACVVGCGVHCESETGCASVCGEDRAIYTHAPAMGCVDCMAEGSSSIERAVDELVERSGGERSFAAVGITRDGVPMVYSAGDSFPWAYCESGKIFRGCARGESLCDKIDDAGC